ncbi:hypothetical protein N7470_006142 [Penicillium chermesinum]|nr:hypothetical protein N7470_006142 [Penicillium chermesinum]
MEGFQRLLAKGRDRRNRSRQGRTENGLPLSQPIFKGFFSAQKKLEETQEFQDKVKAIEKKIRDLRITTLEESNVIYALRSTAEDKDEAFELLLILKDSIEGVVREYTPSIKLLGAENRGGVTCYLDALLFAMFARLDCFEPILYTSFDDEPRQKLVTLLRFWVNLLRSGKLIKADITKHLQDALAECGWEDAGKLKQQDSSEAFTFITEKLDLPLLTLKMDIFHPGKEDVSDDHKFVNERLLEVALPPAPTDGTVLTLEDCLEAYFNNIIEVKRYKERQSTLTSNRSMESLKAGVVSHVEEIDITPTLSPVQSDHSIERLGDVHPSSQPVETTSSRPICRRDSIVRERPFSSKRPILGMSLKRYSFLPNGNAIRLNTYVDIPTEIGLPHFIQDDNMDANAPIYGNFKLSLQAMVCHSGHSVDSGHYISVVRGTSPNVPSSFSEVSGHPPVDTPKHWMRFDDLARDQRVTLIDIDKALKSERELPYLLFYQILPIGEDPAMTDLAKTCSSGASTATLEGDLMDISRKLINLTVGEAAERNSAENGGSARPSFEITNPDGNSEPPFQDHGRRASVTFSGMKTVHVPPPRSVPASSPKIMAISDEETGRGFPFGRRGSRVTKSSSASRANSQSGEQRVSAGFTRFTFSQRLSKDKFTLDGDGESDESAIEVDEADDTKLRPFSSSEAKEKSPRGRTKDRRSKGKDKENSKEKNRKLERECIVI